MADYGFATYNPRTKKLDGEVNSKYPIFGPKYNSIATQFKTFHLNDTYSLPIQTASLSLPAKGFDGQVTSSSYHAYIKTLIKQIPHGGKNGKIPLGYITMTGNIVKNTRSNIQFTKAVDVVPVFCDAFTKTGSFTTTFPAMSAVGEGLRDTTSGTSFSGFSQNYVPYPTFPNNYPTELSDYFGQIIPGNNSSVQDADYTERFPYSVEVDSQYIKIYRWSYWCDIYTREVMGSGDFFDVRTRTKGTVDYAGSTMDFTIYLCPYSLEDLV